MELTREKVLFELINILRQVQEDITDQPEKISESTRPIGDLCNFDSLTSVSVTLHFLNAIGIEESLPSPSLFIGKNNKALTVGEVANRIIEMKK